MPDEIWERIRARADLEAEREPLLRKSFDSAVLSHASLESALAALLSLRLATVDLAADRLREVLEEALADLGAALRADVRAVVERNPACESELEPFLYFKGYHGLQAYRAAHRLWRADRRALARLLQQRVSEVFAMDIHPAARIGRGVFIDHGTSVVIGETAVVEDDVSLLHEVTLGGTGKQAGDRHPKIRRGVLIGTGAKILGNVEVGEGAKVGAGSVVLANVPPHTTVAGVPAWVVGHPRSQQPALEMDQSVPLDYTI